MSPWLTERMIIRGMERWYSALSNCSLSSISGVVLSSIIARIGTIRRIRNVKMTIHRAMETSMVKMGWSNGSGSWFSKKPMNLLYMPEFWYSEFTVMSKVNMISL